MVQPMHDVVVDVDVDVDVDEKEGGQAKNVPV